MEFIVAGTFEKSVARLTSAEQKAAKLAAFDLQINSAKPGFSLERLDRAKDPNFWSARATSDIRIIVHRSDAHFVLCYAGHHDDAYRWAERRRFDVHPATGSAQFVEIAERTLEVVHRTVKDEQFEPAILRNYGEEYLFSLGVPREWMDAVMAATDGNILDVLKHLPEEAQERLLEVASGNPVPRPNTALPLSQIAPPADPFLHPDAQKRFRVIGNAEQLQHSLDKSWSRSSLVPDREGVERGIRLFRALVESANSGQLTGISYVGFIEYLHGVDKLASLIGRNYLPSDSGIVVRIALSITAEAGGRQEIVRPEARILAGMDTFIWSKQRPFDRPLLAWKNYPAQPPYSREAWLAVFPAGKRRLLRPVEMSAIAESH